VSVTLGNHLGVVSEARRGELERGATPLDSQKDHLLVAAQGKGRAAQHEPAGRRAHRHAHSAVQRAEWLTVRLRHVGGDGGEHDGAVVLKGRRRKLQGLCDKRATCKRYTNASTNEVRVLVRLLGGSDIFTTPVHSA